MENKFLLIILLIFVPISSFCGVTKIGKIEFKGVTFFKTSQLVNLMDTKKGSEFDRDIFKKDMEKIVDLYRENGFFDMKVIKKEQKLNFRKKELILVIYIDEGKRWQINKFRIRGNSFFSEDSLKNIMKIKERDYYSNLKVKKGCKRIYNFYRNNGFPFITVKDTTFIMDTTLYVLVDISEGKRYKWGDVIFENLKMYKLSDVRKYVTIKKGDYFSSDQMDKLRTSLYRSGFFNSVFIRTEVSEDTNYINIIVSVREKKHNSISLKLGYQWILSGYLGLEYTNNYIFSNNIKFRMYGYISGGKDDETVTKMESSISFPYLWKFPYDLVIIGKHRQDVSDTLWYVNNSLSSHLVKNKNNSIISWSLGWMKEFYTKSDTVNEYVSSYIKHGTYLYSLNNQISPTLGYKLLVDIECGYVWNRNFTYLKTIGESYKYFNFKNGLFTPFLMVRFGFIYPNPTYQLSPDMLFSMGGESSLRGYDDESIGDYYLGFYRGTRMAKFGGEFRIRLWKDLYWGIFSEFGLNGINSLYYGYSAGMGIRYLSIIGVLRMDVSLNKDMNPYFYIGIGEGM